MKDFTYTILTLEKLSNLCTIYTYVYTFMTYYDVYVKKCTFWNTNYLEYEGHIITNQKIHITLKLLLF